MLPFAIWWFSNSAVLFSPVNRNLCKEVRPTSPCIYWLIPCVFLFDYLVCSNCSRLATGPSFSLAPAPFQQVPWFFKLVLTFWYHVFQVPLECLLPQLWDGLFPREALVLFSGEEYLILICALVCPLTVSHVFTPHPSHHPPGTSRHHISSA